MTLDLAQYADIPFQKRTTCSVCLASLTEPLLSFPKLPLTELFTRKKLERPIGFLDQEFYVCERCGHGQLGRIVRPDILYGAESYFFRTSHSGTAKQANDVFLAFIRQVLAGRKFRSIVEIGCSDLYLIHELEQEAQQLVGIDPVLKGKEKELSGKKIKVVGDFFEHLPASVWMQTTDTVVISSHTLEHIEDPRGMIERLFAASGEETLFIFQFPILDPLIADSRYDQIFHQHLHYFSEASFLFLINQLGGEVITSTINYHHWGALMVAFRKKKGKQDNQPFSAVRPISRKIRRGYRQFCLRMKQTKQLIEQYREEPMIGFGATYMLPILGYHLQTDFSWCSCILDDDPQKEGLYYINLPVPIRCPRRDELFTDVTMVVTAYNTMRSALPRILQLRSKRILFPVQVI